MRRASDAATVTAPGGVGEDPLRSEHRVRSRVPDLLFRALTALCAGLVVLAALGILVELVRNSRLSLARFGWRFLASDEWNPVTGSFGALSSVFGTVVSTAIAMASSRRETDPMIQRW